MSSKPFIEKAKETIKQIEEKHEAHEEEPKPDPMSQLLTEGYKGVKIIVRELRKLDLPWGTFYDASVQLEVDGRLTHVFQVDFRTPEEFAAKVKKDIDLFLAIRDKLGDRIAWRI